jgi:hypothetical protein
MARGGRGSASQLRRQPRLHDCRVDVLAPEPENEVQERDGEWPNLVPAHAMVPPAIDPGRSVYSPVRGSSVRQKRPSTVRAERWRPLGVKTTSTRWRNGHRGRASTDDEAANEGGPPLGSSSASIRFWRSTCVARFAASPSHVSAMARRPCRCSSLAVTRAIARHSSAWRL